ncbi:MAG: DUF6516 family protein [Candidatus Brevundimonas colombiensis]|uniref:DUF6516 family protein n=1 Tax=Candidatus Brevundimonas colombiensis TaxID=3121376 RepID=A0AAJ5X5I1_9CAUL|nr:DUF6516 family protein [Brevundimonas sp.]WEK40770.1 MAG: DUF6516 family protein [Brevundimonas sp.]
MESLPEHELAFLLDFDGARYLFDEGYWVKIEVRQTDPTPQRPHGLSYSFTLHDPDGQRLLGFDNAHAVPPIGGRYKTKPVAHDHWHRTSKDKGRPYDFRSAFDLVQDFLSEVERILGERGVSAVMVEEHDEADDQDKGPELGGVQE